MLIGILHVQGDARRDGQDVRHVVKAEVRIASQVIEVRQGLQHPNAVDVLTPGGTARLQRVEVNGLHAGTVREVEPVAPEDQVVRRVRRGHGESPGRLRQAFFDQLARKPNPVRGLIDRAALPSEEGQRPGVLKPDACFPEHLKRALVQRLDLLFPQHLQRCPRA